MAHLWFLTDEKQWCPTPLFGDAVAPRDGALVPCDDADSPRVVLRRLQGVHPAAWALLTDAATVRLNGLPVPLGLAVLDDRDEIRVADRGTWFSTEVLPAVEPFPASTIRGYCPRCKQAIEAAALAVKCPACGLWHHASEDLPCWTYAPACAACPQPTALDAGFRWTPEDL